MKILLSPAKTVKFDQKISSRIDFSIPIFIKEATTINDILKNKTITELSGIMGISDKLSIQTYTRVKNYKVEHSLNTSKQAGFIFFGEVYKNLNISSLEQNDIDYLQKNLFILSGFYGVLKPLDIIQPYRLEMGTDIDINGKKNLYKFWTNKITDYINNNTKEKEEIIINLASQEYSKVINRKKLKPKIIDIYFKEYRKGGEYKNIPFYAKKARGLMLNFLAKNKIFYEKDLKCFCLDNYTFDLENSDEYSYIFIR